MKSQPTIVSRAHHTTIPGLAYLLAVLLAAAGCGDRPDEAQQIDAEPVESSTSVVESVAGPEPEEPLVPAPAEGLHARIDLAKQRVEGSYDDLRFEVEQLGEGRARARFQREGNGALISEIQGPHSGIIDWNGTNLDGSGAPTAAEIGLLSDLEAALPTQTLALVALDLACEPGAERLDPVIGAALLLPYQMQLYYRMPPELAASTIRALASRSRCQHFRRPMEEMDPARTPSASVVALSQEQPAPLAHGYFPFDIGSAE